MQYIINKQTGKIEFSAANSVDVNLTDDQIIIEQETPIIFENPYFDFETKTFYDKL